MSIADQRAGISTLLAGLTPSLRVYGTMPTDLVPPCAVVWPDEPFIDYLGAMGNGLTTYRWLVQIYMGQANARDAQAALDAILDATGASSLNIALRADPTLSGSASSSKIIQVTTYGVHDFASIPLLGAYVHIETIASN